LELDELRMAFGMETSTAAEFFQGLSDVVPPDEVRMSGAWESPKHQRRYASPEQAGTGDGPFVETVDWRWEGNLGGAGLFVGLALLVAEQRVYWVKSQPPAEHAVVSFSACGWADRARSVSVTGSFHGAHLPSVPVEIGDEPPTAWVLGEPTARVGVLHVVARVQGVEFAVLLLPASAVQVGRNHLWHLHESIAARLRPELNVLLTRGRSGCLGRLLTSR
jgi:hypothetical protein